MTLKARPRIPPEAGSMKRMMAGLAGWTGDLSVAEKIYGIAAGLMVVTTVLMVMSIQPVRLPVHRLPQGARAARGRNQPGGSTRMGRQRRQPRAANPAQHRPRGAGADLQ
jgi:hypothetical protein